MLAPARPLKRCRLRRFQQQGHARFIIRYAFTSAIAPRSAVPARMLAARDEAAHHGRVVGLVHFQLPDVRSQLPLLGVVGTV
jgi:hypothetical protein